MSLIGDLFGRLFNRAGYPATSDALQNKEPRVIPVVSAYDGNYLAGQKWFAGLSNSGAGFQLDHYNLRQNARTACQDSPEAKALVDRFADSVVDVGLKLEPTPNFEALGITAEKAEQWSRKVEAGFDAWARDKRSTRDETATFYQAQRLAEIFQQRDNDYFVRFYYSGNPILLNPLQIGFVDPNQIRGDAITSSFAFQSNSDGIKRDAAGKEIAYDVYIRNNEKNKYDLVTVPATEGVTGRRLMLHGFNPEFAGQGRGFSRLSHALQEFENLTDFTAAQIKKAINQSAITMYVKPSKDNDASNPLEELLVSAGAGPVVGNTEALPETPAADVSSVPDVNYRELPEAQFRVPGSAAIFSLKEGEDLAPFKDTAPSEAYEKFVGAFLSHLSASVGMPLEVLLMKFSESYSASRASLILFWRVAEIWRQELIADFLHPVYESWLAGEIAAGRIVARGWSDPRMRAAWLSSSWVGIPMPNIDPMKTAKADKTYIELGAQTLDRVAKNLNGSSGSHNRAKQGREFSELVTPPWNEKKE